MVLAFGADFFGTISEWFSKLIVDAETMATVIEWANDIPLQFGSLHPVLNLVFGLFGVFLTLKIIIHLL